MGAYRFSGALRPFFDIKANGQMDSPASTYGTSDYRMVAGVEVVASTQELELAKKICTDLFPPSNCCEDVGHD